MTAVKFHSNLNSIRKLKCRTPKNKTFTMRFIRLIESKVRQSDWNSSSKNAKTFLLMLVREKKKQQKFKAFRVVDAQIKRKTKRPLARVRLRFTFGFTTYTKGVAIAAVVATPHRSTQRFKSPISAEPDNNNNNNNNNRIHCNSQLETRGRTIASD